MALLYHYKFKSFCCVQTTEWSYYDISLINLEILLKSYKLKVLGVSKTVVLSFIKFIDFFFKLWPKLLTANLYSLVIYPLWIIPSFIDLGKFRKGSMFIQITPVCKLHPERELSMLSRTLTPSGHRGVIEEILLQPKAPLGPKRVRLSLDLSN